MHTTQGRTAVAYAAITDPLTRQLLDGRTCLPHGANGHGPRPSDPCAAQIRKDIGQGRADPLRLLYTVMACDARDGVPFSEIVASLHGLIAAVEVVAVAARARRDMSLPTLVRAQAKAQFAENLAEHAVLEHPDSPDVLAKAITAADRDICALDAFRTGCARDLSVIRCQSTPAFGARRGALASVR
jgi:hypothetical protein